MEDGVGGLHDSGVAGCALAGVQIAIEAREVAAGDFQANAMAFQEDVAGGPEIDLVLVDLARFNRRACRG